jgi:hypothetical protein
MTGMMPHLGSTNMSSIKKNAYASQFSKQTAGEYGINDVSGTFSPKGSLF